MGYLLLLYLLVLSSDFSTSVIAATLFVFSYMLVMRSYLQAVYVPVLVCLLFSVSLIIPHVLQLLLPSFPGDDAGKEQDETVRRLFAGENFRFGNPLDHFFRQLHDGQLTDQIHSLRRLTAETQRQDAK